MLLELRIRDLAVIQDLSLTLGAGLNILSGETGAGKSIIVGALSLLLGDRASPESVRAGAGRAVIEAVFDLGGLPGVQALLDAQGIPQDDHLLVLRREVQAEGRSRAWVNGSPVTVGVVGAFGRSLIDLHGQHEYQTLLDPAEQRRILDGFGGAEAVADRVRALHGAWVARRSERAQREARSRELASRAEFLEFQRAEIQTANPHPGEDTQAEEELRRLDHAEEWLRETQGLGEILYSGEGAVSEQLAVARDRARRLARLDDQLSDFAELLDSLYHQAVEAGRRAEAYAEDLDLDPKRAERLRNRLDVLFRLKRKYGPGLEDVLASVARMERELQELRDATDALDALDEEIRRLSAELHGEATQLSERRREAAARLAMEADRFLPRLGMAGGRFEVHLEGLPEPDASGAERIEFRATLNPGFPFRALARIASGGELSRVMLALKSILVQVDPVPTLVFDEVDAGIGGSVALSVGEALAEVARHHQVLVITHLPQVAARGDRHLRVEKGEADGVATTQVVALSDIDRVEEIARMLGGDPHSAASQAHARELLGLDRG
jgi:DNA repair protein RecN (Recombination protein N)